MRRALTHEEYQRLHDARMACQITLLELQKRILHLMSIPKALVVVVLVGLALAGSAQARLIVGTSGPDILRGTGKADTISGKAGNDRLFGFRGHDRLIGGAGKDVLKGARGPDFFYTIGQGHDVVFCGDGFDRVVAGPNDELNDCESVEYGGLIG